MICEILRWLKGGGKDNLKCQCQRKMTAMWQQRSHALKNPVSPVIFQPKPAGISIPNCQAGGLGMRKYRRQRARTRRSCIIWGFMSSKLLRSTSCYILFYKRRTGQGQQRAKSNNAGKENIGYLRHSCLKTNDQGLQKEKLGSQAVNP